MKDRCISAGLLGRYYSARHVAGQYRSCAVSGRYTLPAIRNITSLLEYALAKNIARHPSLCYSITPESRSSEAQLVRLETINWNDVVAFYHFDLPGRSKDSTLSDQLGHEHERLWIQPNKPIWRLVVLAYQNPALEYEPERIVDIAFICHHAIADGISASAFHTSLLTFLQEACTFPDPQSEWPVLIPSYTPEPLRLEDLVKYTPRSDSPTAKHSPSAKAWTASPPSLPSISEYGSRVNIITIPHPNLAPILQTCRRLQTTITGLLHSLITMHLSKSVPSAQGFEAITPYSMRRFTNLPATEIANHVSYTSTAWGPSTVEKARSSTPNTIQEEEVINTISQQYHTELTHELAQVPSRGPLMLNSVAAIRDFTAYCAAGLASPRGHTYELSNIGLVKLPLQLREDAQVRLERLVFTQCGMVAGPAFGCGVVSLVGGPMTVSFYWQEGILEEVFMGSLRRGVEERLLGFSI